jgi:phosphotransferase system enzyme I (PtsI)
MSIQVFGLAVSKGVAIGRAVLIASSRMDVAHYFVDGSQVEAELDRLRTARDEVAGELQNLQRDMPADAPGELNALLDVHLMLLHDETMMSATMQWVRERHYNAEWALSAQLEVLSRQFDEMEDEYLRERKADIEQVVERLLRSLQRSAVGDAAAFGQTVQHDFGGEEPLILVANDIAPADMLQFKRSVFAGFVTDVGGKTSHTAIVARSMDIPADWVVIDGDAGVVIINPPPIVLEEYRFRQRQSELERARLHRLRHTPAVTLDGERVELQANIEMPRDAQVATEAGAVGVGLFRTEFLFMNRDGHLPSEDEQFECYRSAVEHMQGLPMTIRTVDVGADKPLDRMSIQELRHEHVLNPALGLRAIRWSLSEPEMFLQQLRAILRASAYGKVRILVPMVGQLNEVRQTLAQIALAKRQLTDEGIPFTDAEVGAMVEIPATAIMIPLFAPHFDFLSIGTNDLIQYTLAIDRADEQVAHLYDPWHPAVLQLVAATIDCGRRMGKSVSVCGEMAGDPVFTEILLAMGLRSFSMHPSRIAEVKQRILRADTRHLVQHLQAVLAAEQPELAAAKAFRASR